MKKAFLSFLLIIAIAITGCSAEPSDDANAKFVKGEDGDWIFNFTADEFVEKWINDPFFKGTDFEVGSDETMTWMIDKKKNVYIVLSEDSKKSKVSGIAIATDYDISVSQVLQIDLYALVVLKYLDEKLFDKSISEQTSDALNDILNHKKEDTTLVIDDYLYNITSKNNKWIQILILPRPDANQAYST